VRASGTNADDTPSAWRLPVAAPDVGRGFGTTIEFAAAEKINSPHVSRLLRRTLLAPEIVEVILDCRCYGGCPSGAELVGCGCEADTQQLGAPDGQP
jgi:hypothetical protein